MTALSESSPSRDYIFGASSLAITWLIDSSEIDVVYSNLRYHYSMKFGHISHSLARPVRRILRLVANSVVTESSSSERRLSDGSELMGEYNYRTSKMDCGSDPIGWYEDDV